MAARHKIGAAFLGIALAVTLAACGSSGDASGPSSTGRKMTKVTYLTAFISNGVYSPFAYGKSKGYFAKQGIDLQLKYGTGSPATVQAVANGQADIGDAFSGTMAQAVAKGADVKAFGFFRANGAFAFFCDKSLNITKFSQLKGRSVVIPPGTVQASLYPGVLQTAGLSKNDIKVDSIAPAAAGANFAKGQGDCIVQTLGDAPTFESMRPVTTLLWSSGGYAVPGFAFFSKAALLSSNPDLVAGFLRASYQSIAAALEHPKDAVTAFTDANPIANPTLSEAQFKASKTVFCTTQMAREKVKIGYQLPAMWSTIVAQVKKYGDVPASLKPESLYTNQFFKDNNVSATGCTDAIAS